jgi:hypothetical protein
LSADRIGHAELGGHAMPESQLELTVEEQQVLVEVLQDALKEARLEEHRTDARAYREQVTKRKDTIAAILDKLGEGPR